jgi:hypothetical protein
MAISHVIHCLTRSSRLSLACLLALAAASGCRSPYHADQGALFGGLTGAGVGALVGNATGHTGAGAAIGAGVGALTGAAVGGALDDIEARNHAEIEARMGRPPGPGAVSIEDVIAMTQAGVSEEVIATHVRNRGVVRPLQTGDLIALQNNHVSARVVRAMQEPPVQQPVVVQGAPPPVVVHEYYGPPYGYYPYYHRPCPPRVGFGFTYHHRH